VTVDKPMFDCKTGAIISPGVWRRTLRWTWCNPAICALFACGSRWRRTFPGQPRTL